MAKTELTKELENNALRYFRKLGTFLCPEVGISIYKDEPMPLKDRFTGKIFENIYHKRITEIVDVLSWESKHNIWRCYEIKITKSDYKSKSAKTFVGNYNYYIMTDELYEQVKNEIPGHIGVYTNGKIKFNSSLYLRKKAKRQQLQVSEDILKYSMIKSLYREVK